MVKNKAHIVMVRVFVYHQLGITILEKKTQPTEPHMVLRHNDQAILGVLDHARLIGNDLTTYRGRQYVRIVFVSFKMGWSSYIYIYMLQGRSVFREGAPTLG